MNTHKHFSWLLFPYYSNLSFVEDSKLLNGYFKLVKNNLIPMYITHFLIDPNNLFIPLDHESYNHCNLKSSLQGVDESNSLLGSLKQKPTFNALNSLAESFT